MAISNTNLLQTNKPLSLPLLAFITMIFLMLLNRVNSADSLSFNFNKFDEDQEDIIFQGDAKIDSSTKALQLTKTDSNGNPVSSSVGRALYCAQVRLWESSAVVASFDTTFTFVISSPTSNTPADGLTFFIASANTTIPPGSAGALLGLFSNANALNNSLNEIVDFKASSDKVVAVEFDTYPNLNIGDPNYRHIGIDVNSIRSSAYSRWEWQNGVTATAHISYNSASRRLSVVSTYPNSAPVTVSYDLNLNTVLSEWVRVGFSGSTGQYRQINNILSWSFSTSLRRSKVKKEDIYIARVV